MVNGKFHDLVDFKPVRVFITDDGVIIRIRRSQITTLIWSEVSKALIHEIAASIDLPYYTYSYRPTWVDMVVKKGDIPEELREGVQP